MPGRNNSHSVDGLEINGREKESTAATAPTQEEKPKRKTTRRSASNSRKDTVAEGRELQPVVEAESINKIVTSFKAQTDAISQQLEIKDNQIREKDKQLEDRSREIAQLHEMLIRTQSLQAEQGANRPWWKSLFARDA